MKQNKQTSLEILTNRKWRRNINQMVLRNVMAKAEVLNGIIMGKCSQHNHKGELRVRSGMNFSEGCSTSNYKLFFENKFN